MSRRLRLAAFALLAAVAFSATACADLTGPSGQDAPTMDMQGSNT